MDGFDKQDLEGLHIIIVRPYARMTEDAARHPPPMSLQKATSIRQPPFVILARRARQSSLIPNLPSALGRHKPFLQWI